MQRRDFVRLALLAPFASPLPALAKQATERPEAAPPAADPVKDYLFRMREPDHHYPGDIRADGKTLDLLNAIDARLARAEDVIGYANFTVASLDDILAFARNFPQIGEFARAETELIERLFYEDASHYGFLGTKPLDSLTQSIGRNEIVKIRGSGHYLYRGRPTSMYDEIRAALGSDVILTSGVRGIVKQLRLFVAKATSFDGNLSLASRSLAPPGYSFHGIGDFDVGIAGWGARNFTADFAETEIFKRLIDLGYVAIRYPLDNRLGVRFEPWHIRVG
ncbi:MAG: D-alanyl-D-alanine carboxypeptidase family protein [Zoogloeaceae bacterium]|nr:M15 family metallopeptidase [Rhodocyclaceae bacterium]MCP5234427.1 D-alanyl-D-alanine carboxypeptidase family protein [Zoogloeaceae bacterium]